MVKIIKKICIGFALGAWGCVTPSAVEDVQVTKIQSSELVETKTILPKSFKKAAEFPKNRELLLSESLLKTAKVSRPRAEVRSGPGIHFQLVDKMINRDTSVYLFERVGVWQKVLAPDSQTVGWVHYRVLTSQKPSVKQVAIDLAFLPTVFSMETITRGFGFPDRNPLKVKIPKGFMFKSLKKTRFGTLVWLEQTNSVLWIRGEAVQ